MKLKLGKDGFEETKDRITKESFSNGTVDVHVSCDENDCHETAESLERKACDCISGMVGQEVESLSLGSCDGDRAYSKNDETFYKSHNFKVNLKGK